MKKESIIGIIGMGYAGLPVACLFAQKYKVVGYDMAEKRIAELHDGFDRGHDFSKEMLLRLQQENLQVTTDQELLKACNFYVVVVPTPVDERNKPDLTCVKEASKVVGEVIGKGDIVVYESTVYPGVTEEVCVPIIEQISGLRFNEDFFAGFSPERIDPGNKKHTIYNTVKITSGSTPEAAAEVDRLYGSVLQAGTHRASSIKVAETAKVLENVQRDVNIALMNELAKIMTAMNIDTNDVIDAAATKWNFQAYRPGLVGGHCIGVDPFYLIERAEMLGIDPILIRSARQENDSMGNFVADHLVRLMTNRGIKLKEAKILLLGFTFKENCPDVRNTKVNDIYRRLSLFTDDVTVVDPWADPILAEREYGVQVKGLEALENQRFDGIMLCVSHNEFKTLDINALKMEQGVAYDVKAALNRNIVNQRL